MATAFAAERTPFTYEDYLRLPDSPYREEILEGELIVSPSPSKEHQWLASELWLLLRNAARTHDLGQVISGPYDVVFSDTDVVAPDLVFVSRERADIARHRGVFGAPDLIVEVMSKYSGPRDTRDKFQLYARYGVPHYWVFDPQQRRAWVFRLVSGEYELAAEATGDATVRAEPFGELELRLAEVWPPEEAHD